MKGVAVGALVLLAAAASQQTDAFLLAKLQANKAQQAWLKHSQQRQGRCVACLCAFDVCLVVWDGSVG